jgi:hypothetical protein
LNEDALVDLFQDKDRAKERIVISKKQEERFTRA